MGLYTTKTIYKIARITGSQNNILGISFAKKNMTEYEIEIIEWPFPSNKNKKIITSKDNVLKQVIFGLNDINKALSANYKLCKISFSPFDSDSSSVYSLLVCKLICHYHYDKEFTEV